MQVLLLPLRTFGEGGTGELVDGGSVQLRDAPELTHRWSPQAIIYEKYGMQADEAYIKKLMHERHCRCTIP